MVWERGGEEASRVPAGPPGQQGLVVVGGGRGFVLQFRACTAKGGNPKSRPAHRPGSQPAHARSAPLPHAQEPEHLRPRALQTPHLTEDRFRPPPRKQAAMLQPSHNWSPSLPPIHPGLMAASRSRHCSHGPYLTSFGSRPVSLRIFSSTFFRLSLAFSSCSCKVLTATAIFSPQQAPRLLHRPPRTLPCRQRRGD